MFNCPSCQQASITFWQKAWADRVLPGRCKECGVRFYKPIAPQVKYVSLALLIMLLIAFIAFKYNLLVVLAFNVLPIIWAFVKGVNETPLYIKNESNENHK